MAKRTPRDPSKYHCVTEWGFTPIAWPDFVKRFPQEAKEFAQYYTEGWSEKEITDAGGPDATTWPELWDDEMFLDKRGRPSILGNITGPGGSLWLSFQAGEWQETIYDDEGHREDDPDFNY